MKIKQAEAGAKRLRWGVWALHVALPDPVWDPYKALSLLSFRFKSGGNSSVMCVLGSGLYTWPLPSCFEEHAHNAFQLTTSTVFKAVTLPPGPPVAGPCTRYRNAELRRNPVFTCPAPTHHWVAFLVHRDRVLSPVEVYHEAGYLQRFFCEKQRVPVCHSGTAIRALFRLPQHHRKVVCFPVRYGEVQDAIAIQIERQGRHGPAPDPQGLCGLIQQ